MVIAFERSMPNQEQYYRFKSIAGMESADEWFTEAADGCSVIAAYDGDELIGVGCMWDQHKDNKVALAVHPSYEQRNIDGTMKKLLFAKRSLHEFGIRCNIK